MRRRARGKTGLAAGLSPRAKAVLEAFHLAKFSAPGFVLSCGIFPEVSESASDRLHSIVHEVATRKLKKTAATRALQRRVQQLASAGAKRKLSRADIVDNLDNDLTAVLAAEATAAYLFGLSVGLAVRSLPDRLEK